MVHRPPRARHEAGGEISQGSAVSAIVHFVKLATVAPDGPRAVEHLSRSRPMRRWPARIDGFTAVELMNFLALAAVLTAVGMYALAAYVRHAKTAEAHSSLASLATAAAEYYDTSDANQPTGATPQAVQAMRHFPPSSRVGVPEDALNVRAKRYQSNLADWSASPWRELHFSIVQPQCFQYAFEASGAGASAKATVTAEADLDGDGERSSYSIAVEAGPSLTAQVGPLSVREPEE